MPSGSLTCIVLIPAAMSFCMSAIATPFDCVMGQVGMSILESGTSTHSTDSDFREQGFTCCAPAAWSRWWCEEAPPPLVLPPPPRVVASEPACCMLPVRNARLFLVARTLFGLQVELFSASVSPALRTSEMSFESHTSGHTVFLERYCYASARGKDNLSRHWISLA